MKEFNCDRLMNLPVSEELVNKALLIPQDAAARTPKRITLLRRGRLAVAASIILVAAVSISLYFYIGNINDSPISVAPVPIGTNAPTEIVTLAPTEPTIPSQEPTDIPAVIPSDTPKAEPTAPTAPTAPADTDRPAETEPVSPPVTPTSGPEPTAPPQILPTEDSTEAVPPEPWEGPTPTEGQDPVNPQHDDELASVGFMVPIASYTGSEDLYCRLYSSGGRLIGGEDLFDESRRVYFTTGSGYLFLSYPLSGIADPLPPDNYTIVFYDADGNDFYICSAFLSRK